MTPEGRRRGVGRRLPTARSVLLAGATGTLGARIAHHILAQPGVLLRLLVRGDGEAARRAALAPLLARGAEVVVGDLADPASLDRATEGVDVVVSAVSGGREVIVDGQVALAEAASRNGARRILPSAFSLDFRRAPPGEHPLFDLRAESLARIEALGIEHVHLLQGAFMDLFRPGAFVIGADGVAGYWGEGTDELQVTSLEDTARMAARVALDEGVPSGTFAFAGDRVSILSAVAEVERRTGRAFQRRRLGSRADLRRAFDAARRGPDPIPAAVLAFHVILLDGRAALTNLQNGRYPDLALETFAAFADRTAG